MSIAGHAHHGAAAEDVADSRPDEREAAVEELMSRTHLDMAVRIAPDWDRTSFRARVRKHVLHDLALVDATCDPCSGARGRQRAARTTELYLGVMVIGRGRETVHMEGASADLHPGGVAVWRSDRPARFQVHEPQAKRTLIIPRQALDEVGGAERLFRTAVLDPRAPATGLLVGYLHVLAHSAERLGLRERGAARNAALELFASAARGDGSPGPASSLPPRSLVNAWIDRRLAGGDLTPARIAAAHGMSVRSLYRMFEESGETVAAYVRTRRLARARQDVLATADTISDVAVRWGFPDASHFSRAFRGVYGCSPRDYRDRFSSSG